MIPIIGITCYRNLKDGGYYLPDGYVESVREAGGIPLLLTPGESNINQILQITHGIVFAGGGDINPSVYGGPTHSSINRIDSLRDTFELALADKVFKSSIPVLGICRGFQLLAVARGANLITHLADETGETIKHVEANGDPVKHMVRVEPESRLAIITGSLKFDVFSKHHQAVREISDEWRIMATAEDGIVEALENKNHPWMISVLWHPEMSPQDPFQQKIFRAFVEAARKERA